MGDKTIELFNYIYLKDMQAFEKATPKRKAQLILNNFQKDKNAQARSFKAKTEEEKASYTKHAEGFWWLANKQTRALNEDELYVYLSVIYERLAKVISEHKEERLIDNKLFFGTVLRELPNNMSDRNNAIKEQLNEMLMSLNYSFEK